MACVSIHRRDCVVWCRGYGVRVAHRQAAFRKLLRGQVFIGLAGAVDRARVEAPDMVEDIVNAGVRFVHLSREDVRRTKARALLPCSHSSHYM